MPETTASTDAAARTHAPSTSAPQASDVSDPSANEAATPARAREVAVPRRDAAPVADASPARTRHVTESLVGRLDPRPRRRRGHRLPRIDVWTVDTRLVRRNPATGQLERVPAVLVRWKKPNGRSGEQRFYDRAAALRFAETKRRLTEDLAAPGRHLTIGCTFWEWTDTYLCARFPAYVRTKVEGGRLSGDVYPGLLLAAAKAFLEHIGDRPLPEYRASDFERFRARLTGVAGLRPATAESYVQRIRTLFRAAEADRLLDTHIKIEVRTPKYEKAVFEREQVDEIIAKAAVWPPHAHHGIGSGTGRLVPILITLYYTMMRRGELIHLTWDDVRREDGRIVEILVQPKEWDEPTRPLRPGRATRLAVAAAAQAAGAAQGAAPDRVDGPVAEPEAANTVDSVGAASAADAPDAATTPPGATPAFRHPPRTTVRHRWEPKDREVRAIPVHPRVAAALEELARERGRERSRSPWVFRDGAGRRWTENSLASLMNRFAAASKLKLGFHVWRRTGITHLHDAGAPVKDIQSIAGHASITTTMRYIRSSAKGQRATILKLQ